MSMSRNFWEKNCLMFALPFVSQKIGRWLMRSYRYINTLERENSELREQLATLRRKFRRTQRRE
jgi:hypothetical protein